MLLNCREVPTGTMLETDVCIIGAGPAGLTIAKEMSGKGLRIAILERGGPPSGPVGLITDGVKAVDSDFGPPPVIPPRFAGGANEWIVRLPWMQQGVRMVPLSPIDLEARSWVPDSGWPISWDELQRWYGRAHQILEMGAGGFRLEDWECDEHPRLPFEHAGFTTAIERFSRADVFTRKAWRELRASRDVTVCLNAPVGALAAPAEAVEYIEIDAGSRARLRMRAKAYVLASGGLDNPRLLLGANDGRGLGDARDVVGRYYMDHFRFLSGQLTPNDPRFLGRLGLYDIRSTAGGVVMGKLVPTDQQLRCDELLHSGAAFLPRRNEQNEQAVCDVSSAVEALRRGDRPERLPSVGSIARVAALVGATAPEMTVRQRRFPPRTDAGWSSLRRISRHFNRLTVEHQVEHAPQRGNRVRLSTRQDEYGRPSVDVSVRWGELDLRSARVTQELFGRAVETSGIGTFTQTPWDEQPPLTTPAGAFHPMGGTRMHPSPQKGVVDGESRVHGMNNLFVAGSSVFPTGGYANPTFTLVAMSVRLADHLARALCVKAGILGSLSGKASYYWAALIGGALF